jgi:hypothetical protein
MAKKNQQSASVSAGKIVKMPKSVKTMIIHSPQDRRMWVDLLKKPASFVRPMGLEREKD